MSGLELPEPLLEVWSKDVADPETVPADLVGVGRSDAFQRGADLALPSRSLVGRVQKPVGRKNQVRLLGYEQLLLRVDVHLLHVRAFLPQRDRIQNDTASDDVGGAFTEYS